MCKRKCCQLIKHRLMFAFIYANLPLSAVSLFVPLLYLLFPLFKAFFFPLKKERNKQNKPSLIYVSQLNVTSAPVTGSVKERRGSRKHSVTAPRLTAAAYPPPTPLTRV